MFARAQRRLGFDLVMGHYARSPARISFTTEVWTWRGLVTYYTVFVIDLASRRVHIVGSTPRPDDLFMCQVPAR